MASNDDGKILHRDPVVQRGFTQTENIVLTDTRLSVGARFLYTLLKMHAWQADNAFPGQARLGEIMGIKERMVRLYLAELYQYGHITKEQRGLTQTNRYYIEPLQQVYADCLSERQYITGQERQDIASQDRQPIADKEDSAVKKTQPNKREIAPAPVTGDIPRIEPIGANRDMATIPPGMIVTARPDAPKLRAVPKFAQTPEFAATLDTLIEIWPRRKDGAGPNRKLAERALVLVAPSEYPAVLAGARRVAASPDSREGVIKNLHAWLADEDWTRYTVTAARPKAPGNPQLAELERRRAAAQVRGVS